MNGFICFPYKHVINFTVEQVASIKYKTQMDIVNVIDILPFLALSKNKSRLWIWNRISCYPLTLLLTYALVWIYKLSIFCVN